MKNKEYLEAVNKALLAFQMIEEGLKICVGMSYEIIHVSVPRPLVYKFQKDSILNAPLGRLIKMYSQVTENKELVDDLKKIVEWRNFCAHNAFSHEFLSRTDDSSFTQHTLEDVHSVIQHASSLALRIGKEIEGLKTVHSDTIG